MIININSDISLEAAKRLGMMLTKKRSNGHYLLTRTNRMYSSYFTTMLISNDSVIIDRHYISSKSRSKKFADKLIDSRQVI